MTTRHTPGPWHVDSRRLLRVADEKDNTIASTGTTDLIRNQWEANARLIAASPMLLEALELAVSELHSIHSAYGDKDHARAHSGAICTGEAVISRARGE